MAQKRLMPSKEAIKKYWDKDSNGECRFRFIEDFGWSELPTNACWKCGQGGYVEKAHIHSRCYSHDDTPSNLHLLCSGCHKESEFFYGFEPGLMYYEWFYAGKFFWLQKQMRKFISDDLAETIGDNPTMTDLEKIMKIIHKERSKLEEEARFTGKMVFDKKQHSRFEKLSKLKGIEFTDYMIHEGVF